jgi:5'-nucleotidase/UDP-sugar diphosphatase
VMGGHNHIVINPPEVLTDCTADPQHPGFIWVDDPNLSYDPNNPPNDPQHPDPFNHPGQMKRGCTPRGVTIAHSGAFSKYVGRLDLVLSNDPAQISPTGNPRDYEPVNGFEVVSSKYIPYPIDTTVPEDPYIVDLLQPYKRILDRAADLSIIAGFSPLGAKRIGPQKGDSPLGNLIATSMWLRLGVQTDFSMTNSTGIRTDLNPGPVTIEEMYNIFPFDNTITKMQLSGIEVRQMFDFIARRSASRSCDSQAQIAGSRVRINCSSCTRPDANGKCNVDGDCSNNGTCNQMTHICSHPCNGDGDCASGARGACDLMAHQCIVTPCAEQIFVGDTTTTCTVDSDCPKDNAGNAVPGICDKPPTGVSGFCSQPIAETNLYELATNNYLAGGGSGFLVLQRNTTQLDTKISQRDALIDYMRNGKPCGYKRDANGQPVYSTPEGLKPCSTDMDCTTEGDFVCSCRGQAHGMTSGGVEACVTDGPCDPAEGRCVRRDCRDQVAQYHERQCAGSPGLAGCKVDLNACATAGLECTILSCIDSTIGAVTDNRVLMQP